MRVLLSAVFILFAAPVLTSAQALNPEIIVGRDYTFERMEAKRKVHDANDHGTIRLVAYVYRPLKNDRKEVVLFSHGSTGGLIRSPKEAMFAAALCDRVFRHARLHPRRANAERSRGVEWYLR